MKKMSRMGVIIAATAAFAIGANEPSTIRFLEYPFSLPGAILKVQKDRDENSGRIILRTNINTIITAGQLSKMEAAEEQARLGRLGTLSDGLNDALQQMGQTEKLKVVIKLKYPSISYPDKTTHSLEEVKASSIAAGSIPPIVDLETIGSRYGLSFTETLGLAGAVCEVSKAQLQALKVDGDVVAVEAYRKESVLSPELSTLAASAYNPGAVPSGAGSGVKAATFEYGLSSTFLSCIGVTPSLWDSYTTNIPDEIFHSQATFKCLVAAAPSASFYHRKSTIYDGTNDVNYILNNGIQTVSMSITRGGTSPYRSTYSEFLTMDDFAYRWPYPVFLNPAGNAGYQYETNWQCYNAISVGNVRHTNNSTYEFADCTQTKNPPPIYGSCISGTGANCAGDREMPYIVAPGIPYTGTNFATTCLEGSGSSTCATSWSAPIANGMAADIIAADSRLSGWPEKVRATMILTAQNVDGGYWSVGTDGRDGSGVVSGSEGVSFAQSHTAVSPGNTAAQKGMATGSMYAADFTTGYKRFYVAAPNPLPSGKHLRVVLTWDSNPVVGGTTNALSDMDLIVQTNGGTTGSYSWDGNVEVADVANSSLSASGTYYVDVAPVFNRIPSSGSRTNYFYYALAWEWVVDHAQ